ncbi:hypothetical protein [Chromobacterium amazonense]|uniref:hypothetical protein n=1 Tax=Chromobacterium amazonense TaxID=1382803 RepID=UPI003F790611
MRVEMILRIFLLFFFIQNAFSEDSRNFLPSYHSLLKPIESKNNGVLLKYNSLSGDFFERSSGDAVSWRLDHSISTRLRSDDISRYRLEVEAKWYDMCIKDLGPSLSGARNGYIGNQAGSGVSAIMGEHQIAHVHAMESVKAAVQRTELACRVEAEGKVRAIFPVDLFTGGLAR